MHRFVLSASLSLSLSHCIFLSHISIALSHLFPSRVLFLFLAKRKRARKSVERQSLSFPRVPFLAYLCDILTSYVDCFPSSFYRSPLREPPPPSCASRFPFSFADFSLCSPFVSLFYLPVSCIFYSFHPSHIHANSHSYSRYTHRVTSVIIPRPHPIHAL